MRHLLLACALIPALAFPALAEDAPAAPAKAEKKAETKAIPFAKVAATWPKPAADHAFETQLVLLIGEERAGTWSIGVRPFVIDGKAVWQAREELRLSFGGQEALGQNQLTFGPEFRPMGGAATENFQGKPVRQSFTSTNGTLNVTHTPEGGESRTWSVKSEPWMLPGKVGLFMAARFLPAEKARYEGTSFSHTDDDGPVSAFWLEVDPKAKHGDGTVIRITGERRTDRMELLVDPETRAIIRMRMTQTDSAMAITAVPASSAAAQEAPAFDDIFAREPKGPAEVSGHVIYAVTVKDRALIEKAFRWSTMYEVTKKQSETTGQAIGTFEEWKKATLDALAGGPKNDQATPKQVRDSLSMFVGKVQMQDTPQGWKAVIWPKSFAQILVVMERKDDGWKAVGMRNLGG